MKAHIPMSARQRDILHKEVKREIHRYNEQYAAALDEAILYTLHTRFGFGRKRLKEFYTAFFEERRELAEYYDMPDGINWLVHKKLTELGIDVNEWAREAGVNK